MPSDPDEKVAAPQSDNLRGPWLINAFFCRSSKKLPGGQGQNISGMTTQFYFSGPSVEPPPLKMVLIVAFARGDFVGTKALRVDQIMPSGNRTRGVTWPLDFLADNLVQEAQIQMLVPLGEDGIIWYEVTLDGDFQTRTPFWIERKPDVPRPPRDRPRRRQYRLAKPRE
jgi:hypothetical protein